MKSNLRNKKWWFGCSYNPQKVLTALTTHFKKQEPKTVKYRNYEKLTMKNFDVSY